MRVIDVVILLHGALVVPADGNIFHPIRRLLNFGNLFGSEHTVAQSPYEKIMGAPVFQVTTPWGSTYLNMENRIDKKMDDVDEDDLGKGDNQYRTIGLYYLDPEDALAAHAELKQMQQMKKADIRITGNSLGKALRSSANLGAGLLTGVELDALRGKVKPSSEGGSLRHKIQPPKRQLYYAARCYGKERVGFLGTDPKEEASSALYGNGPLSSLNMDGLEARRERIGAPKPKTMLQAQNMHMEGYKGVPVFWAQGMQRRQPKLKQLFSGTSLETPLFMNYEDLMDSWGKMRKRDPKLPEEPTVEVFNLWDVLTSMDRHAWRKKRTGKKFDWSSGLMKRIKTPDAPDLDSITFIPSSACVNYKEKLSARGNGKARLRPMRAMR